MKKRLLLFIPHMVVLVLVNVAAFIMALLSKNSWMYVASVTLLLLSIVVFYLLISMGKSINKFYQTMEKQLSPYTNKALKDFPLPVLVTRRGGDIIWYNNQGGRRPHAVASFPVLSGNQDARLRAVQAAADSTQQAA